MTHPQRIILFLLGAALLAGCGQKGPLFLPGNPGDIRSEVPASGATADTDAQAADGEEAEEAEEAEEEQP